MKKNIITVIIATLLLGLSGCQTADPNAGVTAATDTGAAERRTEEATELQTEFGPDVPTETETELQTAAQPERETDPKSSPDPEKPEETEEESDGMQYCGSAVSYGKELDNYLQRKWAEKYGKTDGAEANGQNRQLSVLVPILINSDFEYKGCSTPEYGPFETDWIFYPAGASKYDIDFYDRILVATYDDADFYDELFLCVDSQEYPQYGVRAGYDRYAWHLDFGDFCARVHIPTDDPSEFYDGYPLERVFEYLNFEIVTYSPNAETDAVQ